MLFTNILVGLAVISKPSSQPIWLKVSTRCKPPTLNQASDSILRELPSPRAKLADSKKSASTLPTWAA